MSTLEPKDLTKESWREYIWNGRDEPYRINGPTQLFVGSTTHRVVDDTGMVHCIPAPGQLGCVLRWMPKNVLEPVQF